MTGISTLCSDPRTLQITKEKENPDLKCGFCGKYEVNDVEWGLMLKLDDIITHHFCLLFSADAKQNGNDGEGIQGFLLADIKKEVKRGKRLKCRFCRKANATLGCCVQQCANSYHYPCGYENKCEFQFFGGYKTFCKKHKTRQEIPIDADYECVICAEHVDPEDAVWPPCCGKQLFHRKCIMHTAKSSGFFFKCPLCNSTSAEFMEAMKSNGVFIPQQDAEWETEPNAFQELNDAEIKCDAVVCLCPDGRDCSLSDDDTDWPIIGCMYCGSAGTHYKCSNVEDDDWICDLCKIVLKSNSGTGNEKEGENSGVINTGIENRGINDKNEALRHLTSIYTLLKDYKQSPEWESTPLVVENADEDNTAGCSQEAAAAENSKIKKLAPIFMPILEVIHVGYSSLKDFFKSESERGSEKKTTAACTVSKISTHPIVSPLEIERKLEQVKESATQCQSSNIDQNKDDDSAAIQAELVKSLYASIMKRNEEILKSQEEDEPVMKKART